MNVLRPIETAIKAVLPETWVAHIRAYRHAANIRRYEAQQARIRQNQWRLMLGSWRRFARRSLNLKPIPAGRVLLFPSDPRALVGSRGDDAMISAVVCAARANHADIVIDALCEPGSEAIVQALGLSPVVIGEDKDFPAQIAGLLAERAYSAFYAIGADIIDGRFGPRIPALMVIAADLAARQGVRSTILGCSFGTSPESVLRNMVNRMDWRVRFCARDPISMERIEAFASVHVRLVADVAFLLAPGRADRVASEWLAKQRQAGLVVVGVNVHPMLIRNPDAAWRERMAVAIAEAMSRLASSRKVGWLLIPHDYRESVGDIEVLERIAELLRARGHVNFHLLAGHHSAADLKALVGSLHGVVTGRMHLAIAALGMGVPVLGFAYHDKFEGLMRHFRLPEDLLLASDVFDHLDKLTAAIDAFIQRQPELSQLVLSRRDAVVELASLNFAQDAELGGLSRSQTSPEARA